MWTLQEYATRLRPHLREARDRGWTMIDFPSWELERLAGMFSEMMETEDTRYLRQWSFFDSQESVKPDLGVIIRDPSEWNEEDCRFQDDKAFLHYSLRQPYLEGRLKKRGVAFDRYRHLLFGARAFTTFCAEVILPALALAFDLEFPFYNFYDLVMESEALQRDTLRIVWYRSREKPPGTLLAAEHTDATLITVHPWMRYDGLILGEGEKGVMAGLSPGSALVFFGDKAGVATRGFVTPLKHRVVRVGEEYENRTACIFFGHTNTPRA